MRILRWIAQTLFLRSWLILGGIALGMSARFFWPIEAQEPAIAFPEAAKKYRELTEYFESSSSQPARDEGNFEERLNEPTLDELGDIPLTR